MSPQAVSKLIGVALLILIAVLMASSGTYVIHPGYRGVKVTMGKVTATPMPEGFGFKQPLMATVHPISIRQQTAEDQAACYSSDLQQIHVVLRVLYRIPEASVVKLFQEYHGEAFESLVAPRVHEALKEVTALQSAEQIVKNRDQIKARALELAKKKIGTLVVIEDIVIQNIALTKELERAIESKMVQEQEAQRSKYVQQRAEIDASTAVIKAKGEAESIQIRGQALAENPSFVDLQIVDRWDGVPPMIIGAGDNVMISVTDLERARQARPNAQPTPQTQPPVPPRTGRPQR